MQHDRSKGNEMQARQDLGQAFTVPSQASEPRQPPETALDYPPTGQEHEAQLGFREPHHVQADAILGRGGHSDGYT